MKFKFMRSTPVTSDVISFIFEPEEPVSWQPGQYFHYVLNHPQADDRGTKRWFTNAAAPSEGHVMISTRITTDHGSSFKQALQQLKPGDVIEADGPEGDFTVEDFSRNYIFVAGGIGITPFRSILIEAQKQGNRIKTTLLYANRTNEIPFSEALDQLAVTNPNLKIEYVIQPDRIDGELLQRHIEAVENPIVYLSGPEPMVKSFAEQLAALGLSQDSIKTDDFPGYEAD
jgi:ferredoxin-NADP reductase